MIQILLDFTLLDTLRVTPFGISSYLLKQDVQEDENNKIISVGYNGAPKGYDDDKDMTWEREGSFLDTKYAYVCHSELNAILNSNSSVKGCKLYVTLFPCNECAKVIIQSGIRHIIFLNNKYKDTEKYLYYVACTRSQHQLIIYNQK